MDELVSAPGIPIPEPRSPMPTPTRISPSSDEMEPTVADPLPPMLGGLSSTPSSLAAPLPGEGSALSSLPEQELSNSWREAIVDNRQTIAMLKKQGVAVPAEGSTASGPAVTGAPIGAVPADVPPPLPPPPFATEPTNAPAPMIANAPAPPVEAREKPLELATGRTAGTVTSVQNAPIPASRVASPPRPFVKEGSSKLLSFATGSAAAAIVAAMLWNGSWGAGLSGWIAFGAACFIATAGLLNALLNGPGMGAVIAVGFVATLVALAGMTGVFLTGGARTRVIAEAHPFLAPLAAFEIHLAKGLPVATPEVSPSPETTPLAATSPDAAASPEPSATP